MEKANTAKEEIISFLAQNFGIATAKTFHDFYADETLPIFIDAALHVLEDYVGRDKARQQINSILLKNELKERLI